MIYISMLSGGRDSTAMTLKLLEDGIHLDYIVFCDTGVEHEEMYKYLDKLDLFFQRKYNLKITRLYPKATFDNYIWGIRTKGDNEGKRRGTPAVIDQCFWRRESKDYPFVRWLRHDLKIKTDDIVQYTGFVYGEHKRVEAMPDYCEAPLYEMKWKEIEVQRYLEDNEMENPLYKHFNRTGCAMCPKQGLEDKYSLYKHYPKVWAYMERTEKALNEDPKKTGVYPRWHDLYTMDQMNEKFVKRDKQSSFDFGDDPVKDCFCKI